MSKENFLSRVIDEESSARIEGLSQNKTLYVDQFTSSVTYDNMGLAMEEVDENGKMVGKYPRNLKEVFDYFKPEVEVEFSNENKETVSETLKFREIKDFDIDNGNGRLVNNSSFLIDLKNKKDGCEKVKKSIEKNSKLREILKNPESKNEFKEFLESMLEELNNAK